MKCKILHESKGRLRVHLFCGKMSLDNADVLEYYLRAVNGVTDVSVYDRTCDAVIVFTDRKAVLKALAAFAFEKAQKMCLVPDHTSRKLNREFEDKLVMTVIARFISKTFIPAPIRAFIAVIRSWKYIKHGLKALLSGKLSVAVLDATAVTVSLLRGDFKTAASVMFMLNIGEILEDWTHKKSVADLAGAMSLNVENVWVKTGDTETLISINNVREGDLIVVRTGNMIPLDGKVAGGEATVNQASITGESLPVRKSEGSYVYAGTVVEEGECVVCVDKALGGGRYDRIVKMIEQSEKLKSSSEDKASRLADRLVPYTLGGTILTYLLTRNVTKMLAVLMVDFSCALKLSMPIAVLSAMRECSNYKISVKGGKFLEAVSEADTIVFDKTGTLTKGVFEVNGVYPESGYTDKDLLYYAAYAESASSHPISISLKKAYGEKLDLEHVTGIEEIAGHGVQATVDGKPVYAGNSKLMKKNGLTITQEHDEGTVVYIAIDGAYAGCITIADVIKSTSKDAIRGLKKSGIKTVMLTGDTKKTADKVAAEVGVDMVRSELLPADKVSEVEALLEQKQGKENLAFVGDGINDAPVLSRADIGIAMGALGSDAAIEAADVVLMDDDPAKIALAMKISMKTLRIVRENIVFALFVKAICLILGALGIANMWIAIFADVGVMVIAVINATRALRIKL